MTKNALLYLFLGATSVLLLALAGCGGSGGGPTGPTGIGAGSATLLLEELDPVSGTVIAERTTQISQVVFGIGSAEREGPSRLTAVQDMTLTFRLPQTSGFLEVQIINFRERVDTGQPLTNIEVFDPLTFDNGGETPLVRVNFFPSVEDQQAGNRFRAEPGSGTLIVEEVLVDSMRARLDFEVRTADGLEAYRVRSVDATGSAGDLVAALSDEANQALAPVAIMENPADTCVDVAGGCTFDVSVGNSIDPNGFLVQWGVDLDLDGQADQTFAFGDTNGTGAPSNTVQQIMLPTGVTNELIQAILVDEEGVSNASSARSVTCPCP